MNQPVFKGAVKIPVRLDVELPIDVKRQGKWFISTCPISALGQSLMRP